MYDTKNPTENLDPLLENAIESSDPQGEIVEHAALDEELKKKKEQELSEEMQAVDGLELAMLGDQGVISDADGLFVQAPEGSGASGALLEGGAGGIGAGGLALGAAGVVAGGLILANSDNDSSAASSAPTTEPENTSPVASSSAPRTASEGGSALTGALSATDADAGDVLTFALATGQSSVAGFTLSDNGAYSFDPSDAAYDGLRAGEVNILSVRYTVSDGEGGTDNGVLQFILVGTNDLPEVQVQSASVSEGAAILFGQLQATDADGDSLRFDANGVLPAGFTLQQNGSYTFNPADPAYDSLAPGEPRELIASFVVSDGNGGTATQQFTINLVGTNDAPSVVLAQPVVAIEGGTLITGQLDANDDGDGAVSFNLAPGQAAVPGFQLNADGSYSFNAADAAYNELALGETAVRDIRYTASDAQNASAEGVLRVTIVGANDQPEVTSAQLDVSEGDAVYTGTLTATDVDGDFLVFSANNLPDGFTLLATGDYVFDPAHPAYNYLAAGEELPVVINFEVSDGRGGQQSGTLEITVTGTNDAPVVGFVQSQSTTEDSQRVITGTVATFASDADASDELTYTETNPGSVDGFVLNADGSYAFTPADDVYQALQAGQVEQISIEFTVTDGNGGETTSTLQIGVVGINDEPVASNLPVDVADEDTVVFGASVVDATGNILDQGLVNDIDHPADLNIVSAGVAGTNQATNTLAGSSIDLAPIAIQGTYGALLIAANGDYRYIAFNNALLADTAEATMLADALNIDRAGAADSLQSLVDAVADGRDSTVDSTPAGQTRTDHFSYTVQDGDRASDTAQLSFVITGQDDPSTVVDSIAADTVATESGYQEVGDAAAGGQLTISDIDDGEDGGPFAPPANGVLSPDGVTYTVEGMYGTFTFVPNNGGNTGTWTYTLDQGRAATQELNVVLDLLGDPVPAVDSMPVSTLGGTPYTIAVNVFGTNDAPTVTPAMALNGLSVAATEGDSSNVENGALNGGMPANGNVLAESSVMDVDSSQISVTGLSAPANSTVNMVANGFTAELSFGGDVVADLTVNANGDYSIIMREDAAQSMTDADAPTFAFELTLSDDMGAPVNVPFNVTLNGATDVFVAVNDTNTVGEDDGMPVLGNVLDNDADTTDTETLPMGALVTRIIANGSGVNAPVATGSSLANGPTGVFGEFGTLFIGSDGDYSYQPNETSVGHLALGESETDTFSYQATDGNGNTTEATLVITIQGSNDAPALSGDTGGIQENDSGADLVIERDGGFLISDPQYSDKEGQSGRVSAVQAITAGGNEEAVLAGGQFTFGDVVGSSIAVRTVNGQYGTLEIAADGNYRYTANSNSFPELAENAIEQDVFNYTVTDDGGASTTAQIVITITGINDAPILRDDFSTNSPGVVPEDSVLTNTVGDNDEDVDVDTITYSVLTPTAGFSLVDGHGVPTVDGTNTTGDYVFDAANAAYQYLETDQRLNIAIEIQGTDPGGLSATSTLYIRVTGTNDTPVAELITADVAEDGGVQGGTISIDGVDADTADQQLASSNVDGNGLSFSYNDEGISATLTTGNGGPVAQMVPQDLIDAINVDADGNYTVDANADTIQNLAENQVLTVTVPYTISDDENAMGTNNLVITIDGANDDPVVTNGTVDVFEDDNLGTGVDYGEGTLLTTLGLPTDGSATDRDNNAALSIQSVNGQQLDGVMGNEQIAGMYGTLVVDEAGNYSYNVDNANADVQALQDNGSLTDTFSIVVTDEFGGTATQTLTVNVNGATDVVIAIDDAPETSIQEANADTGGTSPATGNVLTNDATTADDRNAQDLLVSNIENEDGAQASVADTTLDGAPTIINGEYGTLTIAGNGDYRYDINQGDLEVNELAADQELTDTFTYTLGNGNGNTADLVITITGGNDVPTATSVQQVINEDDVSATSFSGNFITDSNANDVDGDNAALRLSSVDGTAVPAGGTIPPGGDVLASGAIQTTGGLGGTLVIASDGGYRYTPPNSIDVQGLSRLEGFSESFAVTITDQQGATVTRDLQLTIVGQNDIVTFVGSDIDGSVTEAATASSETQGMNRVADDAGTGAASGTVELQDRDTNEGSFTGLQNQLFPFSVDGPDGNGDVTQQGSYGSFTFNVNSGQWTYTLDPALSAPLDAGEQQDETFVVTTDDDQGTLVTTQPVVITVNGAEDGTQFVSTPAADIVEAGGIDDTDNANSNTTGGRLTATDEDAGESGFDVTSSLMGTYGVFTFALVDAIDINGNVTTSAGTWTYELTQASADALNDGEPATDTLTVTANSGETFDIVVNITGSNDAAVITNTTTDTAVTEDDGMDNTATGALTITDDDDEDGAITGASFNGNAVAVDAMSNLITIDGVYGQLEINTLDGSYTYTLDNTRDATQALAENATATPNAQEVFTVLSDDNQGQTLGADGNPFTIVVDVFGANDAPVIENFTGTATEANGHDANGDDTGGAPATGNILDSDTDVDTGDTPAVTSVQFDAITETPDAMTGNIVLGGDYGTLTVFADGSYRYDVDNTLAAVQELISQADNGDVAADGTTFLTEEFTVTVTDDESAFDDATLTITINGATDVVSAVNDEGELDEDSGMTPSIDGNVLTNDATTNDDGMPFDFTPDMSTGEFNDFVVSRVVGAQSTSNVINGSTEGNGFSQLIQGLYGNLTIASNGEYSYQLDNGNSVINSLEFGESTTETFTYTLTDTSGNQADTTATLVLTINGTNDAPSVVNDGQAIETAAGGADVYIGNALTNDTDAEGHGLRVGRVEAGVAAAPAGTVLPGSTASADGSSDFGAVAVVGMYGTLYIGSTGDYRYELNRGDMTPNDPNDDATWQDVYDALDSTDTPLVDTFSVGVFDEQGGSSVSELTFTITGVADTPEITVNATGDDSLSDDEDNAIDIHGKDADMNGNVVFADADNDGTENILVMLTAANGVVSFTPGDSGVTDETPMGAALGVLVLSGSLDDINELFAADTSGMLNFVPDANFNGTVNIAIEADDTVLTSTDTLTITVGAESDSYDVDAGGLAVENFDTGAAADNADVLDVSAIIAGGSLLDADGDASNGTSYVVGDSDPGTTEVTAANSVFLIDATDRTASDVDATVLASNYLNSITVNDDESYVIIVDVQDADGEPDALVFSADETIGGPGLFPPNGDGTIQAGELTLHGGISLLEGESVNDLTEENFDFAP